MSNVFHCDSFDLNSAGPLFLIEANAGTGKTYNIQKLFRRFVEETDTKISEILVVTFTDAATAELRDRIRSELSGAVAEGELHPPASGTDEAKRLDRLRLAVASFDEAAISTIHGFCQRALRQFAFESGVPFDCELTTDDASYREEAVRDFYSSYLNTEGKCPIPLNALERFSAEVLNEPAPKLVVDPATWEENSAGEKAKALVAAVRDAKVPARASAFKTALLAAQEEVNADNALTFLCGHGDLVSATGQRNAPEIALAKNAYDEAVTSNVYRRLYNLLKNPRNGVEARRRRASVLSFNDLLTRMRQALGDNPESPLAMMLRKTYKIVLVDEFQDTDPTQYAIFSTAFKRPGWKLFMIGDPKQAIYAFRGGDFATYLRAREDVPEKNRFTLVDNYRASAAMINSVNQLFGVPGAFLSPKIPYEPSFCGGKDKGELLKADKPVDKPFKMIWLEGDADGSPIAKSACEDSFLVEAAEEIAKRLNDASYTIRPPAQKGGVPRRLLPSDFAVLADSHRECKRLHQLLNERSIPAVIYKSGNVFASSDAKDLAFILEAILEPGRPRVFRSALLTPWCGKTCAEVADFDVPEITALQEKVREIAPLWQRYGVTVAVAKFMDLFHGFDNMAKRSACERHLVNERQIVEILNQQERDANLQPEGTFKFLRRCITDTDSGNDVEAYEERLENDSKAVTIMTIHKSKGLEFPIVVCPSLSLSSHELRAEGNFRTHDADGNIILPIGEKERAAHASRAAWEVFAEKLRLVYVSVTRPAYACILLAGNVKYGRSACFQNAFNYLGAVRRISLHVKPDTVPELPPPEPSFGDWMDIEKKTIAQFGEGVTKYTPAEILKPGWKTLPVAPEIRNTFAVMSYSGMVLHDAASFEPPLPAGGNDEVPATPAVAEAAPDSLPKGKHAGLAVHETFEHIDFTDNAKWRRAAEIALAHYDLFADNGESRASRVIGIANDTLGAKLPGAGFPLNQVPFSDTRREWTFFFPVPHCVDLAPFRKAGLVFASQADKREGFLTGSIDLMFRKDGRYYFADWKTDTLENYAPEAIGREMVSRGYLFQAIVYAVALYNRLKTTLPGFDYVKHFGGGFYCFVRGISADKGIYRFTPTEAQLLAWRASFTETVE